jgi:hypothetical protein
MYSIMLGALLLAATSPAGAYETDPEWIYHGRADSFATPAVIERDKVFGAIPEYRQIREEGLTRDDARYWILLQKANDVFREAVVRAAEAGGYDLIAEKGTVRPRGKGAESPPVITPEVIEAVKACTTGTD